MSDFNSQYLSKSENEMMNIFSERVPTISRMLRRATPHLVKIWLKQIAYTVFVWSGRLFRGPFNVYDFQTICILRKYLTETSNCIDVGANVGHILREIIKAAPRGLHYAFEPAPELCKGLQRAYGSRARILDYALSNQNGEVPFTYYKDSPALSGFKESRRWGKHETVELIVKTTRLDDIIPESVHVDLIKIDVEGAEMLVLQGAYSTLKRNKPIVLFEAGLGENEYSNATPEIIYDFFADCGMSVGLMEYYLRGCAALGREEFCGQYYKGYNYFWIAYDKEKRWDDAKGMWTEQS